jgi:ribosomal-protein-alanine N-acetyltransferase
MLESERLRLRSWRDADREPLAALNADPEVMRHFPATMSRAESEAQIERFQAHIDAHGYGFWALERRDDGGLIGFVGIQTVGSEYPFAPATEIGWRLARDAWGHGYASEAARAALRFGFSDAGLAEIVSFTTIANERSRAVMERIGMTRDPAADFEHPLVEPGSPVRPHVLYRLDERRWRESALSG